MTTDPLHEPRARIARALAYRDAAEAQAAAFLAREPYGSIYEQDAETGEHRWHAKVREHPPLDLRLTVGDCIHNLRAALDNLAWALASLATATPHDRTEFIICETPSSWDSSKWKIQSLSSAAQAQVHALQPFQPYQGRQAPRSHPLWVLNRLWNDDKHRAPIVVGAVPHHATGRFSRPILAEQLGQWTFCVGAFQDGDCIATYAPAKGHPSEVKPEFDFSPTVGFAKSGPTGGIGMVTGLTKLHDFVVDEVMPRFAALP